MASGRAMAWLDVAIWTLIYGGCVGLILGVATGDADRPASWSLGVLGGIAIAAGVVLLVVRSRLAPPAAPGAQSNDTPRRSP